MPALIAMTLTGFAGYAALLPVAPLWAVRGGADEAGAGLVNGVLLLFTVLTQLWVPGALRRFGWGPVMALGMLLLGLPALGHIASDALIPILVLSAVRGVGFGILTVTGSAAVAELVDPARRGAAIGAYGLAIALPNLVLLPGGAWVAQTWGFWVVFTVSGLPLLGIPAALALGRILHEPPADDPGAAAARDEEMGRRTAYLRLLRPTVLLLGVTLAGGALASFAPQLVDSGLASAAALFAMGATAAVARWGMGGLSDRHGTQPFLWPLVLLTVLSMTLTAWTVRVPDPAAPVLVAFVVAAGLVGVSYGGLQNLTLVVAFDVVPRVHHKLASAVWNVGFDLGTGIGSVLVGLVAAGYGFTEALAVAAVLAAATLPLALRRR
ncbi:MAG: MFS transporter [Ornithinimicrobium sp.]|uniref:MFS transporter n=1 Tax=Ornithinimicrobium sp. TaxID=1977084 RepID=UPI003D9B52F9